MIQGVLNVPVGQTAALRLSGFQNRDDGVEHNPVNGQKGVSDDDGLRLRYLDQITTNLRFNLIVDYDRDDQSGPNLFVYRYAANASTSAALAACGITASPDNTEACPAHPVRDHTENGGVSAQFDYDLGGYALTSITAFRGRNGGPAQVDIAALAGVFPQLYYPDSSTVLRQTSQELRITSPSRKDFEWVAGVYLARSTNYANNGGINIIIPDSFVPTLTDDVMQKQVNRTKTDTGALFGQATYHFTSKLSAFVGLRENSETVSDNEFYSQNIHTTIGLIHYYNNVPESSSTTNRNLSGRVGLQYRLNRDLMLYGTATRGYKGPQLNDTVFGAKPTIVKPELPTGFELGAKAKVHGVGIDFNVFYDKVKDYQGQLCVFTPELVCGADNIPQVTTKGVELDLFGRSIRNLTLAGGFIYNPVEYPSGYIGSDGTNIGGTQLTGAPLTKLTLSGEYLIPTVGGYASCRGSSPQGRPSPIDQWIDIAISC